MTDSTQPETGSSKLPDPPNTYLCTLTICCKKNPTENKINSKLSKPANLLPPYSEQQG